MFDCIVRLDTSYFLMHCNIENRKGCLEIMEDLIVKIWGEAKRKWICGPAMSEFHEIYSKLKRNFI